MPAPTPGPPPGPRPTSRRARAPALTGARLAAWAALAVVLAGGLALRLWGIREGLPWVYNIDEADHFVPRAVRMFSEGTLNPHYFANPPAFTYVLHFLFAVAYGGGSGVVSRFQHDPAAVYELARVAAAVLGTLSLWLLYLVGARLFGRAAGLLAAAIEAVAFLPVFYSHLALNDVPTLAPLTASLLGTAGVLRKGRVRDYAARRGGPRAGVRDQVHGRDRARAAAGGRRRCVCGGPAADSWAGAREPRRRRARGGGAVRDRQPLLGARLRTPSTPNWCTSRARPPNRRASWGRPTRGGVVYYLWTFTWGLGWAPALAALAGLVLVWRREAALGWVLVPAPLLFLLFMGLQGRYFGR